MSKTRMSFFKFNIDDYIEDTMMLDIEHHGAYLLLMCKLYKNGGAIPYDETLLSRIIGCDKRRFARVWKAISGFFFVENLQLKHSRILQECGNFEAVCEKNAVAGKASVSAKSLKNNNSVQQNVQQKFNLKEEEEEYNKTLTIVSVKNEQKDDFFESEKLENTQAGQAVETPIAEKKSLVKLNQNQASRAKPMRMIPLCNPKYQEMGEEPEILPELRDYFKNQAKNHGFDEKMAKKELEKFVAHHVASQTRFADWPAACRKWLLKAVELSPKSRGSPQKSNGSPQNFGYNSQDELQKFRERRIKDVTFNQSFADDGVKLIA